MGNNFAMLLDGFQTVFTPTNLMFGLLGTFLGTLVGVLPGIGPALAIGLLLPITLTVNPTSALIMFAAIYYGAMYVSYGFSVALFVAVYIISAVFLGLGIWETVGLLTFVLVLLAPYLFRLSRSTYLNIFVHYDKQAIQKVNR